MATEAQKKRFDEGMTALQKAMEDYSDIFGPQACELHGDDCQLETEECMPKPAEGLTTLRAIVVVTEWSNLDGTSNIEYGFPRDQMTSATVGLLVHAKDSINFDIFGR